MKRITVKTYLSEPDKKFVQANAAKLFLSMSEYIRRVATGTRLPEPGNAKAITDLLKINADQARLGNLLKMALDDEEGYIDTLEGRLSVERLIDDIRSTQLTLKKHVMEL